MSLRIPKPSKQRAQVFGYPLQYDWIIDFGQKHNLDSTGERSRFALLVDSVELLCDELKKDGEFARARFWPFGPPDAPAQIYVARNFMSPMQGSTSRPLLCAKVEKLKKFLDTTDDPRWMDF